jgi:gamma-glutamyltranspeptidase/glutathione hydrolase
MPRALLLLLIATPAFAQAPRQAVEGKAGMVVAVSPPAVTVGIEILKKGGNAVDAAVSVGFAEAVTWPEAGNIGGGGFMVVHPGDGRPPAVFDYREKAPAAATVDMFAKGVDYSSPKTAGVPGTVRGFALAHKRFGKLPWKDLVLPAVKLAEDGFTVNAALAGRLNGVLGERSSANPEFRRVYGKPGGGKWQAGDRLTLPDLGKTLRAIAERGPDAFYTGELAKLLEAEMKASGGLITAADLAKYEAKERAPVHTTYRGYDVYGAPPPSSGGVTLGLMLNMLELHDVAKHPRHSPETVHLLTEVMRRAYCERAKHLGDADFVTVPVGLLTDKAFAKSLAAGIDPAMATPSAALAAEIPLADGGTETTHYSVVDKAGMAVSNTYTLENSFGCKVVVRGAGYILNNEMTDFNHKPGVTDRRGNIGTPANRVAPGKRMLSSMTPTIVAKDGKPVLVTGSPGGRTIINTVLCVVVNTIDYKMPAQAAVDAPRQHHQWFPDRIVMEGLKDRAAVAEKLKAMGHTVTNSRQGDAHTIVVDAKTRQFHGAADPRLDGKAVGY